MRIAYSVSSVFVHRAYRARLLNAQLTQFFTPRSRSRIPRLYTTGSTGRPTDRPAMDTAMDTEAPEAIAPEVNTEAANVTHEGTEYNAVKEGLAVILRPAQESATQTVFYNPIQQFNRDLSVLAIRAYGEHVLALKKQRALRKREKGTKRKREDGEEGGQERQEGQEGGQEAGKGETEGRGTFTILDALSATGLRALRYASEIPFTTCIVANDLSASAIQSMKTNIDYNQLGKKIQPHTGDARAYMYASANAGNANGTEHTGRFDVIDLDPYGTAAPFLDGALQAIKDGGLLCVTCTDAGVWASNGYPEKAFALYGGTPLKGSPSHEGGLRLILHALATSAAKYGLAIEPLLSLSIDFYARVFVRVHRSAAEAKFAAGNMMLVYNCDAGCGAWKTQPLAATKTRLDKKGRPYFHYAFAQGPSASPLCEHCGVKTHLAGPMWAGPLHNPWFIQRILSLLPEADRDVYHTTDRIEGMLTTALEEDLSETDAATEEATEAATAAETETDRIIPRTDPSKKEEYPFYFNLSYLSKILRTSTMPIDAFRGALRHLGYRSTRSHAKPNSVRTDAPWSVLWEIMREWVKQKAPIKPGALAPGSPGGVIMAGGEPDLARMKREVLDAVQSGQDVTDLITKVEAALYRSQQGRTQGQEQEQKIIFDEALGKEASAAFTKKRLVRYQVNPRANWGPQSRAR